MLSDEIWERSALNSWGYSTPTIHYSSNSLEQLPIATLQNVVVQEKKKLDHAKAIVQQTDNAIKATDQIIKQLDVQEQQAVNKTNQAKDVSDILKQQSAAALAFAREQERISQEAEKEAADYAQYLLTIQDPINLDVRAQQHQRQTAINQAIQDGTYDPADYPPLPVYTGNNNTDEAAARADARDVELARRGKTQEIRDEAVARRREYAATQAAIAEKKRLSLSAKNKAVQGVAQANILNQKANQSLASAQASQQQANQINQRKNMTISNSVGLQQQNQAAQQTVHNTSMTLNFGQNALNKKKATTLYVDSGETLDDDGRGDLEKKYSSIFNKDPMINQSRSAISDNIGGFTGNEPLINGGCGDRATALSIPHEMDHQNNFTGSRRRSMPFML